MITAIGLAYAISFVVLMSFHWSFHVPIRWRELVLVYTTVTVILLVSYVLTVATEGGVS